MLTNIGLTKLYDRVIIKGPDQQRVRLNREAAERVYNELGKWLGRSDGTATTETKQH